jgi:hypothetical protein
MARNGIRLSNPYKNSSKALTLVEMEIPEEYISSQRCRGSLKFLDFISHLSRIETRFPDGSIIISS